MARVRRNTGRRVGFVFVGIVHLHRDLRAAHLAVLSARAEPRPDDARLLSGPVGRALLGVDQLGRDELSRIFYGARLSLVVGVISVAVGLSIGLILGSIAGFFGGVIDNVIMRLMDVMLAIPGLLFAIGIVAVLGPGLVNVMIAIGITQIPIFTRLLRGTILAQRENDFVLAARSVGVHRRRSSTDTSFRTRSRR